MLSEMNCLVQQIKQPWIFDIDGDNDENKDISGTGGDTSLHSRLLGGEFLSHAQLL